jgi:hypothetical protein
VACFDTYFSKSLCPFVTTGTSRSRSGKLSSGREDDLGDGRVGGDRGEAARRVARSCSSPGGPSMLTKVCFVTCSACSRHVRVGKPYCPFCGIEQPPASPAPAMRPVETRKTKPRKKTAFVPRGVLRSGAAGVIPLCVAGLSSFETACDHAIGVSFACFCDGGDFDGNCCYFPTSGE